MSIIKHLGDRYEVLSGSETVKLIHEALKKEDGVGLSPKQQQNLRQSFGNHGIKGNLDMPFIAYAWEEKENSNNVLWRLTYPFFFIYIVLITIFVLPIKWLITGKFYLSHGKLGEFNLKWYNKIFDRHW